MGAGCSSFSKNKVTEIHIPASQSCQVQIKDCNTNQESDNPVVNPFMNFKYPNGIRPDLTSDEDKNMDFENTKVNDDIETVSLSRYPSETQENNQVRKHSPENQKFVKEKLSFKIPPLRDATHDIEISRQVDKILEEVISPHSSKTDCTKIGRQSRLMHADLNTVALGAGKKKAKKKKPKPTLIKVKPYEDNDGENRPSTPQTPLKVCNHGIPLVDNLDIDAGGCSKCQRHSSQGERDFHEYLKNIENSSRNIWAKDSENRGGLTSAHKWSHNSVEKALKSFEEFHRSRYELGSHKR